MGAAAERSIPATTGRPGLDLDSAEEAAERKAMAIRLDPKTRPLDGATPWMRLKNRDPRRHYVYVPERGANAGELDLDYYMALHENVGALKKDGYRVETLRPDGPQPTAGCTSLPGKPVMFRGNVLISCPIEFKKLTDAIGDDGSSGQRGADHLRQLYRQRGAYVDTRRISRTPGIRVERNEEPRSGDTDYVTSEKEQ